MFRRAGGRRMSFRNFSNGSLRRYLVACVSVAAFALLALYGWHTAAQEPKKMAPMQVGGGGDLVARGKYIVEDVAMCGTCHTPRLSNGELDRSRWLAGAPVPYLAGSAHSGLASPGASPRRRASGHRCWDDYIVDYRRLDRRQAAARSHAQVSYDVRRRPGSSGLSEGA